MAMRITHTRHTRQIFLPFSNLFPQMEAWWDNMYVRGAVSGLGVANLYISFAEIFRLKRFARR